MTLTAARRTAFLAALATVAVVTATVAAAATPSPPPTRAPNVTRAYAGDDGGAFYLRQVGSEVYGFAEHPGRKYALVLKGTLTGDRIDLTWWDVPKGDHAPERASEEASKGSIQLKIFDNGAKLVRSSKDEGMGASVLREISVTKIPWAGRLAAGFQKTSASNLTGAFAGDDGTRFYVRETSYNVVWVAERDAQPDVRPGWVSVFAGKRTPGGGISGTWADVPKGLELRSGSFGAAVVSGTRELRLSQVGATRTKALMPDYALDWDRFEQKILDVLRPKGSGLASVGYAYAIARGGNVVRSGAGGLRRMTQDGGNLPFLTTTKAGAASTAKTISAVALVKALEAKGLTLDTRIADYLPSCWKKGPGISVLTFRDLLGHATGFANLTCPDPYECLRKVVEDGTTESRARKYRNINFTLLRYVVPFVIKRDAATRAFSSHNCKNSVKNRFTLNQEISALFNSYLFDEVLGPVGVEAAYFPSDNFTYAYDRQNLAAKGVPPRWDFSERGGAGYLSISAPDYARFLSTFDKGEIVSLSNVRRMKSERLGFDGFVDGKAGAYVWKNGGCPGSATGVGCSALAIIFPYGVQAYAVTNSGRNRAGASSGDLMVTLANAYDAALR